jgi:hypothetical protein
MTGHVAWLRWPHPDVSSAPNSAAQSKSGPRQSPCPATYAPHPPPFRCATTMIKSRERVSCQQDDAGGIPRCEECGPIALEGRVASAGQRRRATGHLLDRLASKNLRPP